MTNSFVQAIKQHADLPESAQKKAGKAIAGAMSDKHETFLTLILSLIDSKTIVPGDPKSFLNNDVYAGLTQSERDGIDLALINLSHLLENVVRFRLSKETPDSSPQLQTMIDELWQMKSRIEEGSGDVFKF